MGEMPDIQIPLGFDLEVDEATMLNGLGSSASTVENGVYAVDEAVVSAAANGGPIFTTMKAVASGTNDLAAGILGVAQGVYGNGLQGRYRFNGVMKVRVDGTTDVVVGDELVAASGQNYLVKATTTANTNTTKVVGKALEAMTFAVGVAGYADTWVAFKGIGGYGCHG
jgi:hypothetical protein